jgi:uncharacterized protein YqeY
MTNQPDQTVEKWQREAQAIFTYHFTQEEAPLLTPDIVDQLIADVVEDVRESERQRIAKIVNELQPILWNDDPHKHASNIRLTNNLNTILKALDTPSDN